MKNIAVLIDFTEGSKTALTQAVAVAKKAKGSLFGIHIVSSQDKVKQAETELDDFLKSNAPEVEIKPVIGIGGLNSATNSALQKTQAELVFICTHGIKGMFQQLFGAHILKLVQAINCPCIVISEHTRVDLSQTKTILFPIGPHPEYIIKVKQTANLAKLLGASLIIYKIDRGGADADQILNKNIELAESYFNEHQIPYTKVIEELQQFSAGFSRQTMEYAVQHNIPLMSLMATVSEYDALYGYVDKENFLVNNQGISVLTCNN